MAQTVTLNGIVFNNVQRSVLKVNAGGVVKQSNIGSKTEDQYINGSTYYPIVDAVDIDWNGAVLPNASTTNGGEVTINTTGELLKLINDMQDEIYVLTAAVIALTQN